MRIRVQYVLLLFLFGSLSIWSQQVVFKFDKGGKYSFAFQYISKYGLLKIGYVLSRTIATPFLQIEFSHIKVGVLEPKGWYHGIYTDKPYAWSYLYKEKTRWNVNRQGSIDDVGIAITINPFSFWMMRKGNTNSVGMGAKISFQNNVQAFFAIIFLTRFSHKEEKWYDSYHHLYGDSLRLHGALRYDQHGWSVLTSYNFEGNKTQPGGYDLQLFLAKKFLMFQVHSLVIYRSLHYRSLQGLLTGGWYFSSSFQSSWKYIQLLSRVFYTKNIALPSLGSTKDLQILQRFLFRYPLDKDGMLQVRFSLFSYHYFRRYRMISGVTVQYKRIGLTVKITPWSKWVFYKTLILQAYHINISIGNSSRIFAVFSVEKEDIWQYSFRLGVRVDSKYWQGSVEIANNHIKLLEKLLDHVQIIFQITIPLRRSTDDIYFESNADSDDLFNTIDDEMYEQLIR